MKRIVAVLFSLIFVISLVSCGAKDTTQAEITEASEIGTVEELTAEETASADEPGETNTIAETEKEEKSFSDATSEDIEDLSKLMGSFAYYTCWPKGFNCNNSSFSDDIPAVIQIIDFLYGSENFRFDFPEIPKRFQGLINYSYNYDYDSRESVYKENRKVFDPLFKYDDFSDSSRFYYSADADTVEWIEKELLGGTPNRTELVNNKHNDINCYYCDGRYYFQGWMRNGRGPELEHIDTKKLDDGRYSSKYKITWYESVVYFNSITAVIEKDGRHYWKIFSIDWNLNF